MNPDLDTNVKKAEENLLKLERALQDLVKLRNFLLAIPDCTPTTILMALRCGPDGVKNRMPDPIDSIYNSADHEACEKLRKLQESINRTKVDLANALFAQYRAK